MGQGMITRRGIDTSDATATAEDILLDKSAYVNGKKLTGNFNIYGEDELEVIDLAGYTYADHKQYSSQYSSNIALQRTIPANSDVLVILGHNNTSNAGYTYIGSFCLAAMYCSKVYKFHTDYAISTMTISYLDVTVYYKQ